jgi:hypothetical protein
MVQATERVGRPMPLGKSAGISALSSLQHSKMRHASLHVGLRQVVSGRPCLSHERGNDPEVG